MTLIRRTGMVTFGETDASGRYHYVHALRWAEDTEHQVYRTLGLAVSAFPRRTVEVSYVQPLRDGDEYEVALDVERLGVTSVSYRWTVSRDASPVATGRHVVVHVDEAGRPTPLPPELRAHLAAFALSASGDVRHETDS